MPPTSTLTSVLTGLRHLVGLGDAADLFLGRSHLDRLSPRVWAHPFRRRPSRIGIAWRSTASLLLKRMTRKFSLGGFPCTLFTARKLFINPLNRLEQHLNFCP